MSPVPVISNNPLGVVVPIPIEPLSVIIPSVSVDPFHFGTLLTVEEFTCGSFSVMERVVHDAFPLASLCKTFPVPAPDVTCKLLVLVVPFTSNFCAGDVVPIPIFDPLSVIIPSVSDEPFHLGTWLVEEELTCGSVSAVLEEETVKLGYVPVTVVAPVPVNVTV